MFYCLTAQQELQQMRMYENTEQLGKHTRKRGRPLNNTKCHRKGLRPRERMSNNSNRKLRAGDSPGAARAEGYAVAAEISGWQWSLQEAERREADHSHL